MKREIYEILANPHSTVAFRVRGREGHRQRVAFEPSSMFVDVDNVLTQIVNIDNRRRYSTIVLTAENAEKAQKAFWAQLSDGIFENARTGRIEEIPAKDIPFYLDNEGISLFVSADSGNKMARDLCADMMQEYDDFWKIDE